MTPSASPYAVFIADDWVSVVAQPVDIFQCLRIPPMRITRIRSSIKKKSVQAFKKSL